MNREELKEQLRQDRKRRVVVDGISHHCEGQLFHKHKCAEGIHMNEVIFTRKHIQHLTEKEKEYFWTRVNCSLVCGKFHRQLGHSKAFRRWWLPYVTNVYSLKEVAEFIRDAPTKIKDYNYILDMYEKEIQND